MINPFDCRGFTSNIFAYKTTRDCLCSAKLFRQSVQQSFFFFNKSFLYHTWWTVFRSCRCLQFLQASICSTSWGHHGLSKFILPHCTYFREMQALISVKLIPSMPRGLKCEFSKRLGDFPPKVDSYSANPCSYKVLFQFPSLWRSLAIIFLKKQTKPPNHLKAVSNKINSTYILQLLWYTKLNLKKGSFYSDRSSWSTRMNSFKHCVFIQ